MLALFAARMLFGIVSIRPNAKLVRHSVHASRTARIPFAISPTPIASAVVLAPQRKDCSAHASSVRVTWSSCCGPQSMPPLTPPASAQAQFSFFVESPAEDSAASPNGSLELHIYLAIVSSRHNRAVAGWTELRHGGARPR